MIKRSLALRSAKDRIDRRRAVEVYALPGGETGTSFNNSEEFVLGCPYHAIRPEGPGILECRRNDAPVCNNYRKEAGRSRTGLGLPPAPRMDLHRQTILDTDHRVRAQTHHRTAKVCSPERRR